jgi:CemA family
MQKKVFEPTGLIPRSISRTVYRFFLQVWPTRKKQAREILLDEFRRSRSQAIVSIQCLLSLIVIPYSITWALKSGMIQPSIQKMWTQQDHPIFLNPYQKHRAYLQLQEYQNRRFFDHLLETPSTVEKDSLTLRWREESAQDMTHVVNQATQITVVALTNAFGDLCGFGAFFMLCHVLKKQRLILQSFIAESLYSLSDTTKSFLLILVTDGIVGFHSSIGWQCLGEVLLQRFGFEPQNDLMLLFVSTCPVFLNTMFKYWIFRYLNKISPSTYAIFRNMQE